MNIEQIVKKAELIVKRIDHYDKKPEVQEAMYGVMVELINEIKKHRYPEIAAIYENWYCKRQGIEHL